VPPPRRSRTGVLESEGMARTIGVVTVARSDYGHLVPLLEALRDTPGITLQLYVAGAHLSPRFGETVGAIEADGWPISARVETIGASDAAVEVAAGTGAGVAGFARAFAAGRPDLIVVLGDRAEMLAAAVAALPLAIPVAHLHGGEVTEGAIDEQARHAITKLAHLHFPAAEPYARRIRQMGEEPWRVHCVGAPGLDRFARGDPARDVPPGDPRARRGGRAQRGAGGRPRDGGRRRGHHLSGRRRRARRGDPPPGGARGHAPGHAHDPGPRGGRLPRAPPGGGRDGGKFLERAHRGAVLRAARGQRGDSPAGPAPRGQRDRRGPRTRGDRRGDPARPRARVPGGPARPREPL